MTLPAFRVPILRVLMFSPGAIIAGRYRLLSVLGGGGMGVVWSARNESISRDVAIKVMHPRVAEDPSSLQRFFTEARICGSIRHPGIVDVLDLGCAEDGSPFLVMELLEGEPLAERIQRDGRMQPGAILPIVRDVARTIALAHDKGVIHRDLKPENLFLHRSPTGEVVVKVLDFGVSKVSTAEQSVRATRTGAIIGSPAYMSPEQALGRGKIDLRTDVYSLGVVLYEALSGRLPFEVESYNALIVDIATTDPPRVEALVPGLPAAVAELVGDAMEKQPDRRIQTMAELADRIEKILPVVEDSARVSGVTARITLPGVAVQHKLTTATRWLRTPSPSRRRATIAAAAAGALAVATIALLALSRPPEPAPTDLQAGPEPMAATSPSVAPSATTPPVVTPEAAAPTASADAPRVEPSTEAVPAEPATSEPAAPAKSAPTKAGAPTSSGADAGAPPRPPTGPEKPPRTGPDRPPQTGPDKPPQGGKSAWDYD